MHLRFRGCPVVLDIELSVSARYQKTRRALLRASCLLLLLLLAADSRERRCAMCGITSKSTGDVAETKERLCANQNTKESRRIKHIPTYIYLVYIYIYMEAPHMNLRAGPHMKGDTSDIAIVQTAEHPRASPPGSRVSEHMPQYHSCVRLP